MSEPVLGLTAWFHKLKLDTSAWKSSKDFRLLFTSSAIGQFGSMITYVTIPFQVAKITGSYVAVGIIGVLEIIPLIVFGIWGGAIADTANRKTIIVSCELALMALTALLFYNSLLANPHLWILYFVAFSYAICDGLQGPSLEALLPHVVPMSHLASASAMNSLKRNASSIVGPALGGIIAATLGSAFAYGIDVATYVVSFILLLKLSHQSTSASGQKVDVALLFSGFHYVRGRKDILGTYAIDIAAMLFAFPNALFPFIAIEFEAPWALGLLYASMSIGSLLATVTSGWTTHIHRQGKAIVLAAIAWGVAISIAGLSPNIYFVLFALMCAGAADMVSGLFRTLVWNTTIPLDMRGRLAGIEMLSYSVGPQLGQIRSTFFARAFGLRVSLIFGGALCIASASALASSLKSMWEFDDRTNEHAVHERKIRAINTD
jgi:MFS family permease